MADFKVTRLCVVVMGPSGVGKSTVAQGLADRLGWECAEADEFHPRANIEKMESGVPLDDNDRWPWLATIRDWMSERAGAGRDTVVTCSALKRTYRDLLRSAAPRVRFLELVADAELVESRLAKRKGHFMPASLLAFQFAALEPLGGDEDGVEISVAADPQTVVANAMVRLGVTPLPRIIPSVAATAPRHAR